MKNLFIVFALLFFAPVANFAIISPHQTTLTVSKPIQEQSKKKKRLYTCLAIAVGCVIGGYLVTSTPVLAAIAFVIGLVFCVISLVLIAQGALKE